MGIGLRGAEIVGEIAVAADVLVAEEDVGAGAVDVPGVGAAAVGGTVGMAVVAEDDTRAFATNLHRFARIRKYMGLPREWRPLFFSGKTLTTGAHRGVPALLCKSLCPCG